MRVTWMGHGSFRIDAGSQALLLDPWITGNPVFPADRADEVTKGATAILLTHGHFDHTADCVEIAKKTGAPLYGMYELVNWFTAVDGVEGTPFNKGGAVKIGDVTVTMVAAHHSSSIGTDSGLVVAGAETGFMIEADGKTLYAMGDTDIMADWAWMAELHKPDYAIVPIGGHFTMDGTRAAWGCRKFFDFKGVIPGHFKTFPLLAQSADDFRAGMEPVPVHELEVMGSVDL
ncbi:MAG: metal-dependent hydrolase [Pseudomonadota bacterium]